MRGTMKYGHLDPEPRPLHSIRRAQIRFVVPLHLTSDLSSRVPGATGQHCKFDHFCRSAWWGVCRCIETALFRENDTGLGEDPGAPIGNQIPIDSNPLCWF